MERVREMINISFLQLEQILFQELRKEFCEAFSALLERLDDQIHSACDKNRYEVLEKVSRGVETLVGTVRFRRRCYLDRQMKKRVYLLDELCGLPQRSRIAPGLASLAAVFGATCSYREAEKAFKNLFGERVISHESIRQVVQAAGEELRQEEAKQREFPAGERKLPVLFLEVDGLWASLQREKKPSIEARILVSHEGWEARHPSSEEYKLINKQHFTWEGEAKYFWEEASRYLAAHYDLENTIVVINGDRAPWIRKGIDWFPHAIYQVDQFHLKRELKSLLKGQPEKLKSAMEALEASDVVLFFTTLAEAVSAEADAKQRKRLQAFINDLLEVTESLRDYRVRLQEEYNIDTSGYRGLGAAESQMDLYSNRLKKHGQSWSLAGLRNMLAVLNAKFEGRLLEVTEKLGQSGKVVPLIRQKFGVGRVKEALKSATYEPRSGSLPAKLRGLNASGGLARVMQQLSHPSFSTI